MTDVLIINARVVDGTGNPWFYGDVAITGQRIERIAPPGASRTTQLPRRFDELSSPSIINCRVAGVLCNAWQGSGGCPAECPFDCAQGRLSRGDPHASLWTASQ